ncbi:hypothetical protein TNCV_677851 [Trichonephila clavipes]|nr:hypothetical protein TNCV_677851 [Trichonephila clavipes]
MVDGDGRGFGSKDQWGGRSRLEYRGFSLDVGTSTKQSSIPYHDKCLMLGIAKVVVSILLSGMMAIGRTMGSGRRGYGASSGRKS